MKRETIYPILMSLVLAIGFGSTADGATQTTEATVGTASGYLLSLVPPAENDFDTSADGANSYVETTGGTATSGGSSGRGSSGGGSSGVTITISGGGGGSPTRDVLVNPEPTSMLLLGTGVVGAITWERRRRKKSAHSN